MKGPHFQFYAEFGADKMMFKCVLLLLAVSLAVAMPETGIKTCFTCDASTSNEDCNGEHLDHSASPHGNGTLHTCLMDNPTCYLRFKINSQQTGYQISKGCMDLKECLTTYAWQWDDWGQNSCFYGRAEWGFYKVADPGTECIYCCTMYQEGYTDGYFDGCNAVMPLKIPMPEPNNWTDTTDEWPGHPTRIVRVEPPDYVPKDFGLASAARRNQALLTLSIISISIASFMTM